MFPSVSLSLCFSPFGFVFFFLLCVRVAACLLVCLPLSVSSLLCR